MKAHVTLTYSVDLVVEADSEDEIYDWLNMTTPGEAVQQVLEQTGRDPREHYEEELDYIVSDDSDVDLKLPEE